MTMDVSRLGIEVKSTGIKEATDGLQKLGDAAAGRGGAASKVKKLTDRLLALATAQRTASGAISAQVASIQNLANVATSASNTAHGMAKANGAVAGSLGQVGQASAAVTQVIQKQDRASTVLTNTLKAMTVAATAYGAVRLAKSVVEGADAWQMMQSRLNVATGSMHNAKLAQQQIFETSQKLRQPLEATTQLYTRLSPAMQRMGKNGEDVIKVVEGVGMALKLSGTTGAEASSAMTQLSQSFNAGRLNGQEFNSIAEAAPKLLDAMVEHMRTLPGHANVTRESLKKLGSDGKITGVIMADAIAKAAVAWEEDFKKLPITAEDAMIRLSNAWKKATGEIGEKTGFNTALATAIIMAEDLIPLIANGLADAFSSIMGWISKNKEVLGEIWDQVLGLLGDVWNVGKTIFSWIGNIVSAGEEFSYVGAAVFAIRLAIAGIIDGVTIITGLALQLYGAFVDVSKPIRDAIAKAIIFVIDKMGVFLDMLATAAKAARLEGIAFALEGAADLARGAATGVAAIGAEMDELGKKATASGKTLVDKITNGEGAVHKLLNEQKELNEETKKYSGIYDNSVNKKGNGPAADDKAKKAAQDAIDKHNSLLADMNAKLLAQEEITRRLNEHGLNYEKLSSSAKERIRLEEQLSNMVASGADALSVQRMREQLDIARKTEAQESLNFKIKEGLQIEANYASTMERQIKATTDAAIALEYKAQTYGMAKGAIEELELKRLESERRDLVEMGNMEARIALIDRLIAAKGRERDAAGVLGSKDAIAELDAMLDPRKAENFGKALADGFGKAGKAMGGMIKALENYDKRHARAVELQEKLNKVTNPKEHTRLVLEASRDEAVARMKSYAEMSSAAKGFFKEGSDGYKAMEMAEKAFRAVELAMTIQNNAAKLQGVWDYIMLKGVELKTLIFGSTVETGLTAKSVAESGAKTTASTTAGIAKAFEQMGVWGFAGAAAILAFMASVGHRGGGGGSAPNLSVQRQEAQGTGTVLGDSSAKSKSLSNAMESLAENSNVGLQHSSYMLMHLRSIDESIGGLVGMIVRAQGLTTGSNFGIDVGTVRGNGLLGSGIFGSKTSTNITDTGVILDGVIQDFLEGSGLMQYVDVSQTKKKWYGSSKTTSWREMQDADDTVTNQFGLIFRDIATSLAEAATSFGNDGAAVMEALEAYQIETSISLQGLSGQALQDALQAVISSVADGMAESVLSGFADFQQAGEGYFETVVRVASGLEAAQHALTAFGVETIALQDLMNKQGDVGLELVRESLMAAEAGTSLHEILGLLGGTMEDLISDYRALLTIRGTMSSLGLGENVSLDLIGGAGGIDQLQSGIEAYLEGFFTEAEIQAAKMENMRSEFERLGVIMPETKDGFKALITDLMGSGAAGEELAGRLLGLSETFAELMTAEEEMYQERLQNAKDNLRDAYERESDALMEARDKMLEFTESLKEFREGLIMGEMSPLSALEKYATASQRYEDISIRAMAGDEDAIAAYESVAQEFLRYSREIFASSESYTRDFQRVLGESEAIQNSTQGQADMAAQSLDALKQQVEALITINESVKTVAEAIAELQLVMGYSTPAEVDGSHANGLANVPYDGYIAELHQGERVLTADENRQFNYNQYGRKSDEALVNEIRALREELRQVKEEARQNTGALIAANFEANEMNARTVVDGTTEAIVDSSYNERAKASIV